MEKVLIVIGDATELLDTMYPYYRLQEAGFEPVVITSSSCTKSNRDGRSPRNGKATRWIAVFLSRM